MFDNPIVKLNQKFINKFNPNNLNIIAEAAQGYEGDLTLAKLMIRAASLSNANLIKFQLVFADEILRKDHHHYQIFKKLEMNIANWHEIQRECKKYKIELSLDIFGDRSLKIAKKIKVNYVKIHFTDFFNFKLIDKAVRDFKFVFISLGGATLKEINNLFSKYKEHNNKIIYLFGFQAEPTPVKKNNLKKLFILKKKYPQIYFGFMDHINGDLEESLWLSTLCLAHDIKIFEKHISIDKLLEVEDHVSALAPSNFKKFVNNLEKTNSFLGSGSSNISKEQYQYRIKALKVVVAKKDLPANSKIKLKNVKLIRVPIEYKGERIYLIDDVLNKITKKKILANEPITNQNIK